MDWSAHGWRSAFRIELRVQAIGFASRGWPVLTGTFPAESGWSDGEKTYVDGPAPVCSDWQEDLGTNPEQVAARWSGQPYSLLLATGTSVDALEVDASVGYRAAAALRSLGFPVPIVSTPQGRWYFLISAGQQIYPELARTGAIRLHGEGSWVPMPPTIFHHGVVHWRVKPEICGWRLPSSRVVQDALCMSGCVEESADAGISAGSPEDVVRLVAASG